MNITEDKTIYFSTDDIIWSSNMGGDGSFHADNLHRMLSDPTLKSLILDLQIITDDQYDRYMEFLDPNLSIPHLRFLSEYNASEHLDIIQENFQTITNLLDTRPVYLYFGRKSDIKKENNSPMGHEISIVIQKIGNTYTIYIGNSGYGASYHDRKMDDTLYNESILEFPNIDKTKFEYFFNFISLSSTFYEFYNVAIPLLIGGDLTYNKKKIYRDLIEKYKHKEDNYFEMQHIGSCSFKSVMFGAYIFMNNIEESPIPKKNIDNFFLIIRLYFYKTLLEFINGLNKQDECDFLNASNDSDSKIVKLRTTFHSLYEFYNNKHTIYYTDNVIFSNLLDSISEIETEIIRKIKCNKFEYNFIIDKTYAPTIKDTKDITNIFPISQIHTGDFNDFVINNPPDSASKIVHEFNKFNYLNEISNPMFFTQTYFLKNQKNMTHQNHIFSTTITSITDDISNIYYIFNTKEDYIQNKRFIFKDTSKRDGWEVLDEVSTKLLRNSLITNNNQFIEITHNKIKYRVNAFTKAVTDVNGYPTIYKLEKLDVSSPSVFNRFNNNDILSADFLLFLHILNEYLEYIIEDKTLKEDSDNELIKSWNEKYTNMKIVNIRAYNIFKESYVKLINNNFLTFITQSKLKYYLFNHIKPSIEAILTDQNYNKKPLTRTFLNNYINIDNIDKIYIHNRITSINTKITEIINYFNHYIQNINNKIDIEAMFLEIFNSNNNWTLDYDRLISYYFTKDTNIHNYIQTKNIEYHKSINIKITSADPISGISLARQLGADNISIVTNNENVNQNKYQIGFIEDDIIITNNDQYSNLKLDVDRKVLTKGINKSESYKINDRINDDLLRSGDNVNKTNIYTKQNGFSMDETLILNPLCELLVNNFIDKILSYIGKSNELINPVKCGSKNVINPEFTDNSISKWDPSGTRRYISTGYSNDGTQYYAGQYVIQFINEVDLSSNTNGDYYKYANIKNNISSSLTTGRWNGVISLSTEPTIDNGTCKYQITNRDARAIYKQNSAIGENIDTQLDRLIYEITYNRAAVVSSMLAVFMARFKKNIDEIVFNIINFDIIIPTFRVFHNLYELNINSNKIPDLINGHIFMLNAQLMKVSKPPKKNEYFDSTQYTLPFFINDFLYDELNQMRKIKNINNIIPNIYLLEGIDAADNNTISNVQESKLTLKNSDKYNFDQYSDNLLNVFSFIDLSEIYEYLNRIDTIESIPNIDEKTELILLYLLIIVIYKKDNIATIDQILNNILTKIDNKLDDKISNPDNEDNFYFKIDPIIIAKYIELIGDIRNIKNGNGISVLLNDTFSNLTKYDTILQVINFIQEGLNIQILYDDATLDKTQTILSLEMKIIISDYYEANHNKEFNKIVNFFKINKSYCMKLNSGQYEKSINLKHDHFNMELFGIRKLEDTKHEIHDVYYNCSNEYRVFMIDNLREIYNVLRADELELPPYFFDNFIILNSLSHGTEFIKIDDNFHFDLIENLGNIYTTIVFEKNNNYYCKLLKYNDINYTQFLDNNKISNIDLTSNCIAFVNEATNMVFLYYPYLNILFKCFTIAGVKYLHIKFIESTKKNIKHDNEFIFDTFNIFNDDSIYECLNNNEYYNYIIGNNQNVLLIKDIENNTNIRLVYFIHYSYDSDKKFMDTLNVDDEFQKIYKENKKNIYHYIESKPIIGNVKLFTHPVDPSTGDVEEPFYFGPKSIPASMSILKYGIREEDKHKYYLGNKEGTKVVSLKCDLKDSLNNLSEIYINSINFSNIYEAFQLFYLGSLNINYYLSKYAFNFISKTLKRSKLKNFFNYLNPFYTSFPYTKILYTDIFEIQNEVNKEDIFILITLNNHTPENLRMKKIYFDSICGSTIQQIFNNKYPQRAITNLEFNSKEETIGYGQYKYKGRSFIVVADKSIYPTYKELTTSQFKSKYQRTIYGIVANYIFRQIDYNDTDFINTGYYLILNIIPIPGKVPVNELFHLNPSNAQSYINLSDHIPEDKYDTLYGTLKLIENAKKINFNMIELSNLRDYILYIDESDDWFDGSNGITRTNLTLDMDKVNNITLKKVIKYSLDTNCGATVDNEMKSFIEKYMKNSYKYTITNLVTFKRLMFRELKRRYLLCSIKIKEYKDYEESLNKKYDIFTRTNDIKLTELLFFKTLKEKYEISIYKLGVNLGTGSDVANFTDYNISENIDDYMISAIANPGYMYDFINGKYCIKDNFKVNTLFIFFDYLMSLQNKSVKKIYGGTVMRKEQMTLVSDIMSSDCNVKCGNKFYQLIMGAGKSSYIAPLLSLLLIAGGKYPIHVLPEYLVEPGKGNFKILTYFGITTINKTIKRDRIHENSYIFDEIDGTNTGNCNFIFSDSSIKSILLNVMNKDNMLKYNYLQSKMENSFLIFDEVDDISHPFKCELNYPINSSARKINYLGDKIRFLIEFLQLFYVEEICLEYNSHSPKRDYTNEEQTIKSNFSFEDISIIKKENNKTLYGYYHNKTINKEELCELLKRRYLKICEAIKKFLKQPDGETALILTIDELVDESTFQIKIQAFFLNAFINSEYLEKVDFLHSFFFNVLSTIFTSQNRKEFGTLYLTGPDDNHPKLRNKNYSIEKQNYIAIPFKGVESPSLDSEFADINITFAYTIAAYFANKFIFREEDIMILIKNYKDVYDSSPVRWIGSTGFNQFCLLIEGIIGLKYTERKPANEEAFDILKIKKFEDIFKYYQPIISNNDKKERKEKLINIMLNNEYFLNIFKNHVKEYDYQLNATFSDICSSDFCLNRTGFSGTPYFLAPIDRTDKKVIQYEPKADPNAEGSIFYSIINDNVLIKMATNKDDIYRILNKQIDGSDRSGDDMNNYNRSYKALIDVGAYFVGLSPVDTASIILDTCSQYDRVIYVNEKDIQYYIERGQISNGRYVEKEVVASQFSAIKDNKFIVFFDQKHITGVDVKFMPLDAVGLVLIKNKTSIRDYGQGAYRLRKINITQKSHICIDLTTSNLYNIKYNAQGWTNCLEFKLNILSLLYNNENNIKNSKIGLQAIHNFRSVFRYHLLNTGINKIMFSYYYTDLAINVFVITASKPRITLSKDIGKKIQQIYVEYLEKLYNEFSKIGSDYKLEIKLNELCRLIQLQSADKSISTNELQAQVEAQMEAQQELEQEQEITMLSIFRNLYDYDLGSAEQFYTISDLITIGTVTNIHIRSKNDDSTTPKKTLISHGFENNILMTKLFVYKYYQLIYKDDVYAKFVDKGEKVLDIPEYVFKIIKTIGSGIMSNKYIIMTQEEWIQLLSYNKNNDILANLFLNYNYNMYNTDLALYRHLPEFIDLISYITNKIIIDPKKLIDLIDNLIIHPDPLKTNIKEPLYNFLSHMLFIESYKDPTAIPKSKLNETIMYNFILLKYFNPQFKYILNSNLLSQDLTKFIANNGTLTGYVYNTPKFNELIVYLSQYINYHTMINTIVDYHTTPSKALEIYSDQNFSNITTTDVNKMLSNINGRPKIDNYIYGLLIDTITISDNNLKSWETQRKIYQNILNTLILNLP